LPEKKLFKLQTGKTYLISSAFSFFGFCLSTIVGFFLSGKNATTSSLLPKVTAGEEFLKQTDY